MAKDIKYRNIYRGEDIFLTASEYDKTLSNSSEFENVFLTDDVIDSWSVSKLSNKTAIYKVKYKKATKPINILWGPLKNSGTENVDRKRIQVHSTTPLEEGVDHIAIGAYNAGDTTIYVAITKGVFTFIAHARSGGAYSSLWVDYQGLKKVHSAGIHQWEDGSNRIQVGCRKENIEHLHKFILDCITDKIKDIIIDDSETDYDYVDFSNQINLYKEHETLPRNPKFRDIALEREGYTCEICGRTNTFKDRTGKEYFEGHHLIMYNPTIQQRYQYSLDHPNNIICLCPECHRKIHHSPVEETRNLITDLFIKHHLLLKAYNVGDSLDPIINDYMTSNE